jgi:adenylate kinase
MNIVIFGPPGAGKGTQSNLIVKQFKLHQLSTGELLRKEIKNKTELGKKISTIINLGNLVSDDTVGNLIVKYISDKAYKNRIIFDGYPRNLIQARNLDKLLSQYDQKIDLALKLSVSLNVIKKRILERKSLEKREDDSEEIAIKRFETYEDKIRPVIEFYKQRDLLKVVNGEATISEINSEISGLIDGIKG